MENKKKKAAGSGCSAAVELTPGKLEVEGSIPRAGLFLYMSE